MKKIKFQFVFLLTALLLFSPEITGKEKKNTHTVRVAVIHMNKVFNNYHRTRTGEAKLQKQAELYQDYARQLTESYQKLRNEFVIARDASLNVALSAAERENRRLNAVDKYNQMLIKDKELKEYTRTKQQQMQEEQNKLREAILKEIRQVISNKCMSEGIHLVLDSSARSSNGIPGVLYSSPSLDITDSVLATLNAGITGKK